MTVATRYETIIGIECHVELDTRSKMFCGCSAKWFGAPPNTLTCEVCLGLPGALPYPNRRAIELAIGAGIALNCDTPEHTKFDRKNYMYPDLPKGYQISQFDLPLSVGGWLEIPADDGSTKRIGIRRAHLEEDTGSLLHAGGATLVDFNRSGVPLLEIVSEPDLRSVGESLAYLEALRERLVYAGVAGFKLEEGGARFDRLWDEWESGGPLRTRVGKITVGWSPESRRTYLQRSKEEVDDYRYFPEPDLVALAPDRAMVERIRAALPEMPSERRSRFMSQYGLSDYDARVLVSDRALADWFEAAAKTAPAQAKRVANWVTVELLGHLKASGQPLAGLRLTPAQLGALVGLIEAGTISTTAAKTVFVGMLETGADPADIVKGKGLSQVSDEAAIALVVDAAIAANPKAVADIRAGNQRAIGFLAGAVMKEMKGKANMTVVQRLITERLK